MLVALIVALLQAVLEYVSSNSVQGDKCNTGAIGEYARVSGTRRWLWRHWRRQCFYPELELDPDDVCFDLHHLEYSEVGKVFKGLENLVTTRLENYEKMECYGTTQSLSHFGLSTSFEMEGIIFSKSWHSLGYSTVSGFAHEIQAQMVLLLRITRSRERNYATGYVGATVNVAER